MLLRAVAVCAILAVALAAPDIMEEDEDDEVDYECAGLRSMGGRQATRVEPMAQR